MDICELISKEAKNPIDVIMERKSVRFYKARSIVDTKKANQLIQYSKMLTSGPYGTGIIINHTYNEMGTYKAITHYGGPKESPGYFIGCITSNIDHPDKIGLIDFGYAFEKLVIYAASLGLGTCWLGGFFHANEAERGLDVTQKHKTLCITPFGVEHPFKEISCCKRFIYRIFFGKRKRKSMNSIFFLNNLTTPFNFKKLPEVLEKYEEKYGRGKLATLMECVRWSPSAVNWQEWRIVFDEKESSFIFFTQKLSSYYKYIDIGICMCHFETAAVHSNLVGSWNLEKKLIGYKLPNNTKYHFEWKLKL